jgi:hypothetical protein
MYGKRFSSLEFDIPFFASLSLFKVQKSSHNGDFMKFTNYVFPPLVENVIGLENNPINGIVILR